MPVRGMDHFVAIYGKSTGSSDEATSGAREHAPALVHTDSSRS